MVQTNPWNKQVEDVRNADYSYIDNSWPEPFSPIVYQAKRFLQSAVTTKPQAYQSRYSDQIASLYEQIMNRPAFSYNASRDPLFQQYRDQYIRDGQRAMQDSIGVSAALTGGYGNSWAATAGYQAYGEYLKALNDKLPELEKRAWDRYNAEGDTLRDNVNLALALDNREYGWYRDAMSDWQFDAKLALEQSKFDLQVQKYQDALLASMGLLSPAMQEIYQASQAPSFEFSAGEAQQADTENKTPRKKEHTGR